MIGQCKFAQYTQFNISRQEIAELQAQIAANNNSSETTSSALQEAQDTMASLRGELKQLQGVVEAQTKSEADLQAQIASVT